jgi:GT2 family glycosyltransferase
MASPSQDDRISVVIVTRDRYPALHQTLVRLTALPDHAPIVVVDNGSSDGTAEAIRRDWPQVRLIALGRNLGAAGRTAGILAANTEYVAFSDDDSWWAPGSLDRAVRLFHDAPRLGLLAARLLIEPDGREDPLCAIMAAGPPLGVVPGGYRITGFIACAAVVRSAAYLAVGGFHPRFGIGGEEDLLATDLTSAGWQCAYSAELLAHHAPSRGDARPGRRVREVRNALWTAWLRRSPAGVARRTVHALRSGYDRRTALAGLGAALHGLPWVLRERCHPQSDP